MKSMSPGLMTQSAAAAILRFISRNSATAASPRRRCSSGGHGGARRASFCGHDRWAGDLGQRPPLPLRRWLVAVGRGDDAGHATKPVRPWLARWVFRCLLLEEVGQNVIALSEFTAALRQGGGPCPAMPLLAPDILPRRLPAMTEMRLMGGGDASGIPRPSVPRKVLPSGRHCGSEQQQIRRRQIRRLRFAAPITSLIIRN